MLPWETKEANGSSAAPERIGFQAGADRFALLAAHTTLDPAQIVPDENGAEYLNHSPELLRQLADPPLE